MKRNNAMNVCKVNIGDWFYFIEGCYEASHVHKEPMHVIHGIRESWKCKDSAHGRDCVLVGADFQVYHLPADAPVWLTGNALFGEEEKRKAAYEAAVAYGRTNTSPSYLDLMI